MINELTTVYQRQTFSNNRPDHSMAFELSFLSLIFASSFTG